MTITNEQHEVIHEVRANFDAIFTWDYSRSRPALIKLYEKAKTSQWNGETDLPWDTVVDLEQVVANAPRSPEEDPVLLAAQQPGQPLANWSQKEWDQLLIEMQNWTLSQFMHGEQGALVCTAKIVETVPWIDAKYYASTQVMDEARHVEVFAKYLDTKLTGHYPINAHLRMLLDDIINDSRWDMTYLGMQIMVEGLALAAFAAPHLATELGDPERAARAAEWLARVVLTYVAHPVPGVDLADPVAARHLLSTYVLPALVAVPSAPTKEHS